MNRDTLNDVVTDIVMEHLAPPSRSAVGYRDVTITDAHNKKRTTGYFFWSRSMRADDKRRIYTTSATTPAVAERATYARALAAFIVRFCGARSVVVTIDGAELITETPRARKGTR